MGTTIYIKRFSLFLVAFFALLFLFHCNTKNTAGDHVLFGLTEGFVRGVPGTVKVTKPEGNIVSEFHGKLKIDVQLNSQPSSDVTIPISSSNTSKMTLEQTSLTFNSTNWGIAQTINIDGVDNFIKDGNITTQLVFKSAQSTDPYYNGIGVESVDIIVLDNETYSVVLSPTSFTTTEASGSEHTGKFWVGLSLAPLNTVTVPSITSQDTTEGTLSSSNLTFTTGNWNTPQSITVTGVDDNVEDGNQVYQVTLGSLQSSDSGYNGMNIGPVTVTNMDAEATFEVSPIRLDLFEYPGGVYGPNSGTFTVTLNSSSSCGSSSVPITSSDTSRVTVSPASLNFTAAGQSKTVTVTVLDDGIKDSSDLVTINVGNPTTGTCTGKDPADVKVYIQDAEGPGVGVSAVSRVTKESGQDATFQVRLFTAPSSDVSVQINDTYDINNYQHKEGYVDKTILTFTPTNWNTPQIVTISPVDDYVVDGDIQYVIALQNTQSSDSDYNGLDPRDVSATNLNSDIAGIDVYANSTTTNVGTSNPTISGFVTDDMGNLGSQYATFQLKLHSKPKSDVTLNLASDSSHSDGTLSTSSLTFTPSNWNTYQTVEVTGGSDSTNEGLRTYNISVTVTSSDTTYTNGSIVGKPKFSINSCDNDVNNLVTSCYKSGTSIGKTTEGGGTASFWLLPKSYCSSDITVSLSSSDTTEGTVPASVTISSSDYNVLDTTDNKVVVTGIDDNILDGNISYTVTATPSGGCGGPYTPLTFHLVNNDNETQFTNGTVGHQPAAAGHTHEPGSSTTITIGLGAVPGSDVTFAPSCQDTTECASVSPSTATISASSSIGTTVTFTVTSADDTISDGAVTSAVKFTVTGDAAFAGTLNVNFTNDDDENPAKAVWVTSATKNGEFTASDISFVDGICNGTDSSKPTNLGSATYKGLFVDGTNRVATTDGSTNAGQTGWVLKPNYQYYLWTSSSSGIKDSGSEFVFATNSNGLIDFSNSLGLSGTTIPYSSSVGYWTGMNANMTTNITVDSATDSNRTGHANCDGWAKATYTGGHYDGAYGSGGSISGSHFLGGQINDCTVQKKIICIQQ